MADGAVSIAVRSVYPGKQAAVLLFDVLQEEKNVAGKVVCLAQRSIGNEQQRHHR
ncbi:MAG: hypothetical protein ABIO96_11860 [Nitrospiraceae bacterium]